LLDDAVASDDDINLIDCKTIDFNSDGNVKNDKDIPTNIIISDSVVNSLSDISDQEFATFIDKEIDHLQSLGFGPVAGGIHDPKAQLFYRQILNANDSVLELLKDGYKPDIVTPLPKATDIKNNLSALQNIQFVYTKTDKWVEEKIVKKVDHKPYFINPLTVASKLDSEGNVKLRQCLDLSRTLNDCLRKVTMKMEDISMVLPRVTPGCWMSVLDISAMYCHLAIHPEYRSLFGFAVVNASGTREFYEFLTLPFGTGECFSLPCFLSIIIAFNLSIHKSKNIRISAISC
jgi:hypothetical protein